MWRPEQRAQRLTCLAAQVAGQQGAYVAHVLSRGYAPGFGGIGADPPSKPLGDLSVADRLFGTIDAGSLMASVDDSAIYLKRPFEFLSLGIMAYGASLTTPRMGSLSLALALSPGTMAWGVLRGRPSCPLRRRRCCRLPLPERPLCRPVCPH